MRSAGASASKLTTIEFLIIQASTQTRWAIGCLGMLVVYTAICAVLPRTMVPVFSDLSCLLLTVVAFVCMVRNANGSAGQVRLFWALLACGFGLWTINQGIWASYEVIHQAKVPERTVGDIILFVHIVPLMAAVGLRPHRILEGRKIYFNTLNFFMLLIWWLFLYAFLVFPDAYVTLDSARADFNYDWLYTLQNVALLSILGVLAALTKGGWKSIYWKLFLGSALYFAASVLINNALERDNYFPGGLIDLPYLGALWWFVAAAWRGNDLKVEDGASTENAGANRALSPGLAMLAMMSLPCIGLWVLFQSSSPPAIRRFHLLVTLAAMLLLGALVYVRQYLLDRELIRLLRESHLSLEGLQRLQSQVVQKEKLASLGQLVAGAAHEINNPLTAILGYSELLAANRDLDSAQLSMARKIGQQALRTRDLVAGLLSFAQQSPANKSLIEIPGLLSRAMQMETLRMESKGIKVQVEVEENLPPIWGNATQLLQCCLHILENAIDAMEGSARGEFELSARSEGQEVVLEFRDSGPGIADTRRVFDPFYTTKPVGKGTGLGLSSTYGVVQDHHGQITCHNRVEGGAAFVMRFPVARANKSESATAARAKG